MDRYRTTLRRAALIAGVGAVFGTSTVVAGTGIGAAFNLGVANTVNSTSASVGTTALNGVVNGTQLAVTNSSTVSGARAISAVSKSASSTAHFTNTGTGPALNLNVPAGRVPMVVSAGAAKVPNLNADKLDGLDSGGLGQTSSGHRVLAAGSAAAQLLTLAGFVTVSLDCGAETYDALQVTTQAGAQTLIGDGTGVIGAGGTYTITSNKSGAPRWYDFLVAGSSGVASVSIGTWSMPDGACRAIAHATVDRP